MELGWANENHEEGGKRLKPKILHDPRIPLCHTSQSIRLRRVLQGFCIKHLAPTCLNTLSPKPYKFQPDILNDWVAVKELELGYHSGYV